jgi:hypothetical protein
MSVKAAMKLCILLALMAIGFGVYEFTHAEFAFGSLTFLAGILILSFAVNSM